MITQFVEWSLPAFTLALFCAQFAAEEIGLRIGRSRRARNKGIGGGGIGVVVGGLLGLLAFVLALTLSFASGRFTERLNGTLREANAIGTAWLRAEAIDDPRGKEIAGLLEQYLRVRIEFVKAAPEPAVLTRLSARTNELQSKIWGDVTAIVRARPGPVAVSLQEGVNDAFDMTTAERFAYTLRMPPEIIWLLLGLALLSMGALGYQLGFITRPVRIMTLLLNAAWTLIIVDILDLEAPRVGGFRTSTAAYEWTLQSFQSGTPTPPPSQ